MWFVSAALFAIVLGSVNGGSCDCLPETSLAQAPRYDAVVVATVTEKDVNDDRILYGLDVTETLTGKLSKGHIEVSSQSGPCSQDRLSIGRRYLLALENTDEDPITITRCSPNRLWAAIPQDLRVALSQSKSAVKNLHRRQGLELAELRKNVADNVDVNMGAAQTAPSQGRDTVPPYAMVDYGDDQNGDSTGSNCHNGESIVDDGWTGQGRAVGNECNVCMCTKGHLSCTKMLCFGRSS